MIKLILTFLISLAIVGCDDLGDKYHGKGNMQSWMKEEAQAAGLELRWNMNSDYDIKESYKKEIKDIPLGQKILLLQDEMTSYNTVRKFVWFNKNQSEPYPFKTMVATAICKNTIVFAEVDDLKTYNTNLVAGKYKDCKPVSYNLGMKELATSVYSTVPPFAAPPPMAGSANTQITIKNGQTQIPLIGDPNQEVPQAGTVKK